jgi:excisionase family DNA binding protein
MAEKRLLDVNAAAAHLGVSPRFVRRLVAERRIAFIKLGRHLRFELVDLERFISDGRVDVPWSEPRAARERR